MALVGNSDLGRGRGNAEATGTPARIEGLLSMRGLLDFLRTANTSIIESLSATPTSQEDCAIRALHMKLSAPERGRRKIRPLVQVAVAQHKGGKWVPIMGYPPEPVRLNRSRQHPEIAAHMRPRETGRYKLFTGVRPLRAAQ